MKLKNQWFSSESVSEGHPDKLCDRISDRILDFYLSKDKNSRVACETMASHKDLYVSAEVKSSYRPAKKELKEKVINLIKETIYDTGYNKEWQYDPESIKYRIHIDAQSEYISQGVNAGGAGDQGIMFGYAANETPEYMPFAITYANKILLKYGELRKNGTLKNAGPDAKSQVSVWYNADGKPEKIGSVVLSVQHNSNVTRDGKNINDEFKKELYEKVIKPVCGEYFENPYPEDIHINPTGSFLLGGPAADTGLTGRKIVVDTYGGMAPHGGGAFSGKDPSKVDRSAAYMARYAAKNLVANGLCEKCLIQVAYAIGVEKPLSVMVNSFETGDTSDENLAKIVADNFDFRPKAIIERLDLLRPIYYETAAYGHFGRDNFSWEGKAPVSISV